MSMRRKKLVVIGHFYLISKQSWSKNIVGHFYLEAPPPKRNCLGTFLLAIRSKTDTVSCIMNQHGLSARRMRRRGGCFLTPRSRGSAFFVRGRSPNKYFKQALNVRRGGGVNFLTPCTPTVSLLILLAKESNVVWTLESPV